MPFVRPDVKAFLEFLNSQPGPQMHELDAPTARTYSGNCGSCGRSPIQAAGLAVALVL